jgi:hypothetical protein
VPELVRECELAGAVFCSVTARGRVAGEDVLCCMMKMGWYHTTGMTITQLEIVGEGASSPIENFILQRIINIITPNFVRL